MKYYVIYRDDTAHETITATFEKSVDATGFIEEKIRVLML